MEQSTVNAWFNRFSVQMMIHGHTHRPAIHKVDQTTRIVLGDWNTYSAKILAFKPQDYELLELI